jgi:arylsulfatase A-like enzyme
MDRDVGRVLELLNELKIADDTIVFFASDNGAALPMRSEDFFRSTLGLRGHKRNLYEGGIRVPMVARWPGRIPKGITNDMPWGFWDVLPTFCEIAGINSPKNVDGRSVLPALTGKPQQPQPFLYWELPGYDAKAGTFPDEAPMQAGRMGDWKAVRPEPNGPLELYNLASDPYENKNVAGEHPDVLQKMEALLKGSRIPPRPQAQPPMDWQKT